VTGRIFDIKEFSIHDGPGARITFFLKGCPLRCRWCHNPEGQSPDKELMIRRALCENCGLCQKDRETASYRKYGRNLSACPKGLITECGTDLTPREVLNRVLPLKEMLALSGGGVTFSGGEPLMQWEFLCECAGLLRENGIHVALETCGFAPSHVFKKVLDSVDYVLYDLKIMDSDRHLKATGQTNGWILENARNLKKSGKAFLFRTPRIPGYTDDEENLEAIRRFVGDCPWEILPYNELAGAKYSMLNRNYPLEETEI